MMMRRTLFFIGFITLLFMAAPRLWATPVHIVLLGDSLSDTGNLYTLTGGLLPPHPRTDPNAESLYDPGRIPKRFSNGDIWTDDVAGSHGLLVNPVWTGNPANPVQLKGSGYVDNFAVANSFTGPYDWAGSAAYGPVSNWTDLVNVELGGSFAGLPGLHQQLEAYVASGVDPNALHVVWAGANDLFFAPQLMAPSEPDVVQQAVANLQDTLQTLYDQGARKFIVANLPDLGLTPVAGGQTSIPCATPPNCLPDNRAALSLATAAFNRLLVQMLQSLSFEASLVDIAAVAKQLFDNPAAFGFTDATDPCLDLTTLATACGNPDSYVFWDEMHPTSRAHGFLAQAFNAAIPAPATVSLLLLGMVGMTLVRRTSRHRDQV